MFFFFFFFLLCVKPATTRKPRPFWEQETTGTKVDFFLGSARSLRRCLRFPLAEKGHSFFRWVTLCYPASPLMSPNLLLYPPPHIWWSEISEMARYSILFFLGCDVDHIAARLCCRDFLVKSKGRDELCLPPSLAPTHSLGTVAFVSRLPCLLGCPVTSRLYIGFAVLPVPLPGSDKPFIHVLVYLLSICTKRQRERERGRNLI